VVGLNRFVDDAPAESPPTQHIDADGERLQVEGLRRVRVSRDKAAWGTALAGLETAARGSENVLPPMIEAVKAGATLGEISDRLRAAWGEHRELLTV
jgi:methylmalonyl-CoA mutase N-terminal domain/subunit